MSVEVRSDKFGTTTCGVPRPGDTYEPQHITPAGLLCFQINKEHAVYCARCGNRLPGKIDLTGLWRSMVCGVVGGLVVWFLSLIVGLYWACGISVVMFVFVFSRTLARVYEKFLEWQD
jgi:hypothetical protein